MSFVPLHRARFDLGAGCWIDIEADLGEGKPLSEGAIQSDCLQKKLKKKEQIKTILMKTKSKQLIK